MKNGIVAIVAFLVCVTASAGKPDNALKLPLVEVPAAGSSDTFVLFISGDGGWAAIDREMSAAFASRHLPVVGLNALEYFWTKRNPDGMARDVDQVLRQYLARWKKERVVLVGYSRGADVLPFMVSRLAPDLQRRIRLVALLGPSRTVEFEFHVSDWWRDSSAGVPTAPEVAKLKALHVLCMYGSEEADSLCRSLGGGMFVTQELRGAHHFDGDFVSLANRILEELK